ANARSVSCMHTMLSSMRRPSRCAAAKSANGISNAEPAGPRTSASNPTTRASRNAKIGWKTVSRRRSSRTSPSATPGASRRVAAARSDMLAPGLGDAVPAEPVEHSPPAFLGRLFAVGGPVIRVECVRHSREENDLRGLPRRGERGAHFLDGVVGNARVLRAVEAEHRTLELRGEIDGMTRLEFGRRLRHGPVPGHAGLELRV